MLLGAARMRHVADVARYEKTTHNPYSRSYRRGRMGSPLCLLFLEYETMMKTINEIDAAVAAGQLKVARTSMWRGYISRKGKVTDAHPYKGVYGIGYCVYRPNWESTRYSYVTYYVEVAA
jgi:hypothetical protein